jgi:pyruvate-formate lyase-activating enzyme
MTAVPRRTAGVSVRTSTGASPQQPVKVRTGPDGVHLFDRRSGLNVLFDEAHVPEHRWSQAPRQVSIALTNACDLACGFCYAPKLPAVLDIDRVLAWARELDADYCLGIGFGGGEPTLYRRLPQLCRAIAQTTSLAVTLTTHGHRWTTQLVEQLRGSVHFVRVSVDGVGGTYEKLRDRSFEDLLQRVELISRAFSVGINCVVNQSTLPELDAIAALAAEVGAAELLLLLEQPTGSTPGATAEVAVGMRDWIRGHQGRIPLATGEQDSDGLPTVRPLPGEVGLRSYAHIDAPIDQRGVLAAIKELRGGVA